VSGLTYVGAVPANPADLDNRGALNTQLAAITPNAGSVATQITGLTTGLGATYATKSYVDTQDSTFALSSYYTTRDALNLPVSAVGTVAGSPITGSYYGAASLDGSTTVPLAQLPNVGAGYLAGPWGPTSVASSASTGSTPVKIADWNLGLPSVQFRPLVFFSAFITSSTTTAQPVIEIRIANSVTAPAYGSTTLIAMGEGRTPYADFQAISAIPVPDTTGTTPSLLPTSYEIWVTAWLYDLNGSGSSSVSLNSSGNVANAALYLLRGAL
jgi:hypothetical protein